MISKMSSMFAVVAVMACVQYMGVQGATDEEIGLAFNVFDKNGSGEIEISEIETVLAKLKRAPTDDQLKSMFSTDTDGNKKINRSEFAQLVQKGCSVDIIFKKEFDDMDHDKSGKINASELAKWAQETGLADEVAASGGAEKLIADGEAHKPAANRNGEAEFDEVLRILAVLVKH